MFDLNSDELLVELLGARFVNEDKMEAWASHCSIDIRLRSVALKR